MADWFLGEIRLFPYQYAPDGWADCWGQVMQVSQHQSLFTLLGARYGGDGVKTFNLPDLRGRAPVHMSPAVDVGQSGGTEAVTLTLAQLPVHTHAFQASTQPATASGVGNAWYAAPAAYSATSGPTKLYAASAAPADIASLYPGVLKSSGGGQAHSNMQPYLAMRFCIAVQGVYPPKT